jgi:hypothetical protein
MLKTHMDQVRVQVCFSLGPVRGSFSGLDRIGDGVQRDRDSGDVSVILPITGNLCTPYVL